MSLYNSILIIFDRYFNLFGKKHKKISYELSI